MGETIRLPNGEWKIIQIKEVCQKIVTGGTPLTSIESYYVNGTVPWLKTKEVNFNRIYTTEYRISQEGLNNSAAKLIPENSVIVAMYGQGDTAGRVAINKIPLATNQACCNLIIDHCKADFRFIYYYLKDSYEELVNRKTGSAQPNLNTYLVGTFEIKLPPLTEQILIANLLSHLDDKIDLLHRQNKTLEQLAETLFRQWFVEENSEKEITRLGKIVDVIDNRGKTPEYSKDKTDYPILEVKSLASADRFVDYDACEKFITEEVYTTFFRDGHPEINDILFATVGSIGETAFVIENKGAIAQNVVALRAKQISPFYLYQFLTLPMTINKIKDLDIGAVQPSIKVPHLLEIDISIPVDQNKIKTFDEILNPIFYKMKTNHFQVRTLTQLRDALLPKLMSGEVRVK